MLGGGEGDQHESLFQGLGYGDHHACHSKNHNHIHFMPTRAKSVP